MYASAENSPVGWPLGVGLATQGSTTCRTTGPTSPPLVPLAHVAATLGDAGFDQVVGGGVAVGAGDVLALRQRRGAGIDLGAVFQDAAVVAGHHLHEPAQLLLPVRQDRPGDGAVGVPDVVL